MALLGGAFASAVALRRPVGCRVGLRHVGTGARSVQARSAGCVLQCVALCFVDQPRARAAARRSASAAPSIIAALKNDSTGSGRRVGRLQRFTAAAQAGIAVPFLVICGVQFDQARVAAMTDVGFKPQGLYAARTESLRDRQDRRGAPAVPAGRCRRTSPQAPGVDLGQRRRRHAARLHLSQRARRARGRGDLRHRAHDARRDPAISRRIGTRLLAGRTIDANDRAGAERVVVLSEPLARQLFPAGDPIGQRIAFASSGERAADLHGRRHHRRSRLDADGQSAAAAVPVARAAAGVDPSSLIARGAPSDPSMRGAFENAIADALRVTSTQNAAARSGPDADDVFRELIDGRRADREQPSRSADEFRRRRRGRRGRAGAGGARRLRRHRVHGRDAHARDRRPRRARRVARTRAARRARRRAQARRPRHRASGCCWRSPGCVSRIPRGIRSAVSSRSSTRSPPRRRSSSPCSQASRRRAARRRCSRWWR